MRSSFVVGIFVALGLSTSIYAHDALETLTPCPDCPKSIAPTPVTITAQYQAVSTCVPEKICTKKHCRLEPVCSKYDFVSTTVPCLGGASSTLITKTDQTVELSHVSTVLTSYAPCSTPAPFRNSSFPIYHNASSCTSTVYHTMIVDTSAPFDECGPLALGSWGGSGLCSDCVPDVNTTSQVVHVSKCFDGACSTFYQTWVSRKPTATISPSECPTPVATSTYVSSNGVQTIPITRTYHPTGIAYSEPVTTTVYYTTTVTDAPRTVDCITTITLTFTQTIEPMQTVDSKSKSPRPTAPASNPAYATGKPPHGASNTAGKGGGASQGGSGSPGSSGYPNQGNGAGYTTSTIYATKTTTYVSSGSTVYKTVTIPISTTICPVADKTSAYGETQLPSGSSQPGKDSSYPGPTSSEVVGNPTGTQGYPTAPATIGSCDIVGCFGSSDGFVGFSVVENSAKMSVELCTAECIASGMPFSGLHGSDCYCALALNENCGSEKANGVCDTACPGKPSELCGGDGPSSKKLKRSAPILLNIYECTIPTTTTGTETSTKSAGLPDKSSDPDPEPEKRSLQADMELNSRITHSFKARRGGLLSSRKIDSSSPAAGNFALKQLFGL